MHATVDLDDYFCFMTIEIHYETADDMLPTEMQIHQLVASEP
jgi:hypothetical protein